MSVSVVTDKLLMKNESKTYSEENLSTRLNYAIRKLGITQSELARRIGIKPQVIQYLCTSNAKRSKFALDIADALEINIDWLIAGKGKMQEKPCDESFAQIPIVDWSNIQNYLEDSKEKTAVISYIPLQASLNKKCYAVKMNDSSMVPRFEIGTVLVIDPEILPQENDFVIVATDLSETPIIRQFIKKGNKLFLMPANFSLYKEIEMQEDYKILGTLRQTFYEFNRK